MCFRPADADVAGPRACPHCGKMVFPADGILPKKCPFCREAFDADASAPDAAPLPAPSAPAAPSSGAFVPKAPGAPVPPSVSDATGSSVAEPEVG